MFPKAILKNRTVASLPFSLATKDIVVERPYIGSWAGVRANISQDVVHHSPTGFSWGPGGGPGAADLALNIMHVFLPPDPDGKKTVRCQDGTRVSIEASVIYLRFKNQFIDTLPREGGTLAGDEIDAWIEDNMPLARREATFGVIKTAEGGDD